MQPLLPSPRGPLSRSLIGHWTRGTPLPAPDDVTDLVDLDMLADDDFHLALWCCHNLHYRGFAGLADDLEWEPATLGFRRALEDRLEASLRAEHRDDDLPADPVSALQAIAAWPGPPLARTVAAIGGRRELRELAVHRSAYQLKEADPHTFAIPRLAGRGRSAMVEIQADEYGGGEPGASHAELFAAAMADLGLCATFGHYVDRMPGTTLATDNLVSLFALQRRLRGALVGHLALFEMCSVVPMTHYLAAARRVGGLPHLERFYAVHVEADVHHAELALDGMVGALAESEPELGAEIVFGAAALSRVEARFAAAILRAWHAGTTSLRSPAPNTHARWSADGPDAREAPSAPPLAAIR